MIKKITNFAEVKPDICNLDQIIKVNNTGNTFGYKAPIISYNGKGKSFMCYSSHDAKSPYNHEKISSKPKLRGILQNNY